MNETIGLLSGRLDAVAGIMRNVEPIELKAHGLTVRLFTYEDHGVEPYAELILVVHEERAHEAWVIAFKQAVEASMTQLQQDPEGSWQIVSTHFHDALSPTESMEKINHDIWIATVPLFEKKKDAAL
jgi:putative hydroxymethylpyrimidine transport system substrate-binding protein